MSSLGDNQSSVIEDDVFLLDSNTKDRIESHQLFQELEGRLSSSQSSFHSQDQDYSMMNNEEKMKTQKMQQLFNEVNDDDSAIDTWKDTRIQKLEEFTRDLVATSNSKPSSQKQKVQSLGMQRPAHIDHCSNFESLQSNKQEHEPTNPKQTQITNLYNVGTNINPSTLEGYHFQGSLEGKQLSNYNDQESVMEDDLMLTKSDGTLKVGTNAITTHRSNQPHHQSSNNSEFERRISDIKSKLFHIKNTINSEIENSFSALENSSSSEVRDSAYPKNQLVHRQSQAHNTVYQNPASQSAIGDPSTTDQRSQIQSQVKQKGKENHHCNSQKDSNQNIALSSIDTFQNRLNVIKTNLNASYVPSQPKEDEKERFQMIKHIIDSSYRQSPVKTNSMRKHQEYESHHLKSQNDYQIPLSIEHADSLGSPQRGQDIESKSTTVEQENASLKQKLQVLLKSEQVLNKRLDMVHASQNSEKQKYEEQLSRMQQEIGKMCDLIQEINKNKNNNKKKKRIHSSKCSKRQRIAELEAQVKDLSGKVTLTQPCYRDQEEHAKEQVDPNEIASQRKSGSHHVGDTSNPESKLLKNQVSHLEERLKKFQNEVKENKDQQSLRDQLRQQMDDNEYLRATYNQSYQEMLDTFNQFKLQMESKQDALEGEYRIRNEQLEGKFRGVRVETCNHLFTQELERRDDMIEELRNENVFLQEKITKIRDVFDMQRLPMEATRELLLQKSPATINTLKKEGSKTKLVKKKKLSNHNSNGSAGATKGAYGSKRGSSSGKHVKI